MWMKTRKNGVIRMKIMAKNRWNNYINLWNMKILVGRPKCVSFLCFMSSLKMFVIAHNSAIIALSNDDQENLPDATTYDIH